MKLSRVQFLVQTMIVALVVMFLLVDYLFDVRPLLAERESHLLERSEAIEFGLEVLITLFGGAFAIFTTNYLLKRLRYLEGLHHICAVCKRVNVKGEWIQLEAYVHDHSDADFSHGYCPTCEKKVNDEIDRELELGLKL